MMGDFNFDNPEEDVNISSKYIYSNKLKDGNYEDVWKILKPEDLGKTMKKTNRFPAWRPDRVILKSSQYKASDI